MERKTGDYVEGSLSGSHYQAFVPQALPDRPSSTPLH